MLSWPFPRKHSFITLLFSYFVYNVNKWDNCNWLSANQFPKVDTSDIVRNDLMRIGDLVRNVDLNNYL